VFAITILELGHLLLPSSSLKVLQEFFFSETTGVALGASTCLTGSATGAGAGFGVSTIAFGASATGAAFGA